MLILLGCTQLSTNIFNPCQTMEEQPCWNGELKEPMCKVTFLAMNFMEM
jgi:hypothetical protein